MGNFILLVLGIYIVMATIGGFRRGFLKSLFGFATWFLTIAIATTVVKEIKEPVANAVLKKSEGNLSEFFLYVIIFIIVLIILKIIFSIIGRFINKASNVPGVGGLNHFLGGIIGFVKGLVVVSVVLFFIYIMQYIGMHEKQIAILKSSDILKQLVDQNILANILKNLLTNAI
ncbi:MAG: CvpA family protein [Anaerostipes sp.]|nr:CvpA family protein [Anaerostipes sp.]